ncbi:MAG: hypothetical protein JST16_16910 [Bdellovibrionales bacterium]|nr:hypothetical protein [Bdellovibrionales bacterium]
MKIFTLALCLSAGFAGFAAEAKAKKKAAAPEAPVVSPEEQAAETTAQMAAKFSLEQLDAAANYIRVVVDNGDKPDYKAQEWCGISIEQAFVMVHSVKELIDKKMDAEVAKYPKFSADEVKRGECWKRCHCGVYASLFEKVEPENLKGPHRKEMNRLSGIASKVKNSDALRCAKKESWLCGSDLMKYLKASAAPGQ